MSFVPDMTPQVISIGYILPPSLIPYVPSKRSSFEDYFGDAMMSPDSADDDRIWYLQDNWKMLAKLDVGYAEYSAERGWWLDLASIPGKLESIEKRDDRQGLIGAVSHDIMFAVQFPFFDTANSLFYQFMRHEGTGRFRSWYKWQCVQSAAGYEAWSRCSNLLKVENELKWVNCRIVPEVSRTHRHLIGFLK